MKKVGKSLIILVVFIVLTLTAFAEIVDRVVAVVNKTVITEFQVQLAEHNFRQQGAPEEALKREAVIDFLVEQELVLQEAQKKGVLVTDEELNAALEDIKRQNNLTSDEQLKNALAQEGKILSEFLEDIRQQIQVARIVGQEVRAKVDVSDAEVDDYYQEHRDEFARPSTETGVLVRHILLAVPEDAGAAQVEQVQAAADDLVRQLRNGADFAEIAKTHSQHASAASGGELGMFQPGQLAAPYNVAFTLKSGEISDPIRSEKGFHIITAQHEATEEQGDLIRIKSQIRNMLLEEKAQQQYAEWLAMLKENAYIDVK